ncbi:NADH-ubiquinone oxidoreductase subunit E family protein [Malaciobacter marinus]|uniref:NADH-ubiquinone oxidoreductase subunit E family protein n=1 Tax=Malaciobacter marinus TaxID=505249 RepID=UPI003B006CA7
MKRFDLRLLKDNFYDRMLELMKNDIKDGENAIFLFEIGDFSAVQKSADLIYENGYTLMNSIKFNEVDWTIVVKKVQPEKKETETKEEE